MEDKLQKLFNECKLELKNIGIDLNDSIVGTITISIAKRDCKRYGCCKQEYPDESSKYVEKIGKKSYLRYAKFKKHSIEISRWVMDLNTDIIKNTIMHEIIHCLPNCNNHGNQFKKYANYINYKLNYNISRLGDKKHDLEQSNIKIERERFFYKIQCSKCDYHFYRKRLNCNFNKKYRCGKCGRKIFYTKRGF